MDPTRYNRALRDHYARAWGSTGTVETWDVGPRVDLPGHFCVLRFDPRSDQRRTTYATCGMSSEHSRGRVELHVHSPRTNTRLVEMLYVLARFHKSEALLGLHHIVKLDRPWLPESSCTRAYIARPYLDGPELESFEKDDADARCFWLIPITPEETAFAQIHGVEALEKRFEKEKMNFLDPERRSVVL
ncbi:MAG: suppressor of fused domain protein [Planctomycetota bacterium]|jgi:hypothetical protein